MAATSKTPERLPKHAPGLALLQDLFVNVANDVVPAAVLNRVSTHLRGDGDATDLLAGAAHPDHAEQRMLRLATLRDLAERLGRADGEAIVREAVQRGQSIAEAAWMTARARFANALPALPGAGGDSLTTAYRDGLLTGIARAHVKAVRPERVRALDIEVGLVLGTRSAETAALAVEGATIGAIDPVLDPTEFALAHLTKSAMQVAARRIREGRLESAIEAHALADRMAEQHVLVERARETLTLMGDADAAHAPLPASVAQRAVARGRQVAALAPSERAVAEQETAAPTPTTTAARRSAPRL